MVIRFILYLILFFNTAVADRMFGVDYIGAARYPEIVLQHHPEGWAAGFLWEVDGFGEAKQVIRDLAASGKAPLIRIHGIWKDNHIFGDRESNKAIRRCRQMAEVIKDYPEIIWYVSPFLEPRNVNRQLYQNTLDKCAEKLPENVELVASSLESEVYNNAITEMHHVHWKDNVPGKTIFSFDGMESVDANVKYWKKRAKSAHVFFIWRYTFNCRYSPKDPRPRAERTSCPGAKDIQSIVGYSSPKYNVCTKYYYVNGKQTCRDGVNLYKSHAESYEQKLARSNKPVLIFDVKTDSIKLKTKGKTIQKFYYEKPYFYKKGFYVYRAAIDEAKWGFELAEEILKLKNKPVAGLWTNRTKIGKINPIYRDGYYLNN